ncbi:MAG TPA: response regulator transcription factor, partial [Lautropia sp.]|nr:response regulator transcription factor [Lautropia sp.]
IMLTARDGVPDRVAGLDAGADDYLVKPFSFDELLARVRAQLRRIAASAPFASELLRYADLSVDLGGRVVRRGGRDVSVTAREFDLLVLLLRHSGQVLTRQTIRDRVWGPDFYGDDNVLEVFISTLRRALEAGGEPRLIQTVRGVGYVLRETP